MYDTLTFGGKQPRSDQDPHGPGWCLRAHSVDIRAAVE